MPHDLSALIAARSVVLRRISELKDMRPGSVLPVFRRCGKPNCHCAQPKDPGHGPQFQFSCKLDGKTHSESLPNRSAVDKAEKEIAEYRTFEQLSRELVQLNRQICEARPVSAPDESFSPEEKNG